ncbi:MAG: tRNA lysidine(34) synthetase TilS [Bdellovibrionales bacterium]|nr:tRNA lysidine(34) synthetase TilS [Bdellovibrionales bacterium]
MLKPKGAVSYLLAVSGGCDSIAMLHAFAQLRMKIGFSLSVAHIHHGVTTGESSSFRDDAWEFVRTQCKKLDIPFHSNKASPAQRIKSEGESEAQLRKFRRQHLKEFLKTTRSDYVVMAQHSDDLLETRFIRLLRGVGTEGIVAMEQEKGALLRPFLSNSREDLKRYLEHLGESWCEDPSNQSKKYLRNWLRQSWLPLLERKRPGALRTLARSLEILAQMTEAKSDDGKYIEDQRLLRPVFLQLSLSDKRRVVAKYFGQCGFENFGLSHINELIKRLDVEQNDLTFRLLKKNWRANARHIWFEE